MSLHVNPWTWRICLHCTPNSLRVLTLTSNSIAGEWYHDSSEANAIYGSSGCVWWFKCREYSLPSVKEDNVSVGPYRKCLSLPFHQYSDCMKLSIRWPTQFILIVWGSFSPESYVMAPVNTLGHAVLSLLGLTDVIRRKQSTTISRYSTGVCIHTRCV